MPRGSAILTVFALALIAAPGAVADTSLGTENGITCMTNSTPIPPNQPAAPSVSCPGGTRLIGAGGDAATVTAEGILASLRPTDGADGDTKPDDGLVSYAHNTTGTGRQSVAYAMCAAGRMRYPARHTGTPSGKQRTLRVPCPSGTKVVSGGFYLSGANSDIHLNAFIPYDGGDAGSKPEDGWRTSATNVGAARMQFTAWAFCRNAAKVLYPDLGSFGGTGAGSAGGVGGACTNPDVSVGGLGGRVKGSPGARRITGLVPDDNTIEAGTVPDDVAVADDQNNSATQAKVGAFPVCLDLG